MELKVAYNATAKIATLIATDATLPAGSVDIGNFEHASPVDSEGVALNHVLFQHVQNLLAKYGVEDVFNVQIINASQYKPVMGLILNFTTASLPVGGTKEIKTTLVPRDATNQGLTFQSSDSNKVGVTAEGTIHALAPTAQGVPAVITVTTKEGGHKATVQVVVTP